MKILKKHQKFSYIENLKDFLSFKFQNKITRNLKK